MRSSPSTSPSGRARLAVLAVGLFSFAAFTAHPAEAQRVHPWSPPGADSLLAWSAEAKTLFQLNRGDSVTGGNYRAYELVGAMGRRLFRALGKENMAQAQAIEAVLDSLGLDSDVATDPTLPTFVLLMVRNPYQPSANAVGFVYWFRQDDLRMQGVVFRGGMDPRVRVWWTGRNAEPYEWGIVDRTRGAGDLGLILLRLDPGGSYWTIGQYAGRGQDLGGSGEADWVDANEDGQPELLTWMRASADSMFEECGGCPKLITERLFVEHDNGFELPRQPAATFAVQHVRSVHPSAPRQEPGGRHAAARPSRSSTRRSSSVGPDQGERRMEARVHRGSSVAALARHEIPGPSVAADLHRSLRDEGRALDHRELDPSAPGERDAAAERRAQQVTRPAVMSRTAAPRTTPALVALLILALVPGCQRKTQLVPAGADSRSGRGRFVGRAPPSGPVRVGLECRR